MRIARHAVLKELVMRYAVDDGVFIIYSIDIYSVFITLDMQFLLGRGHKSGK